MGIIHLAVLRVYGKGQLLRPVGQKLRVHARLVASGIHAMPALTVCEPYGVEPVQNPLRVVLVSQPQQLVAKARGNAVGAQ